MIKKDLKNLFIGVALGTTLGGSLLLNVYQRYSYEEAYHNLNILKVTLEGIYQDGDFGVEYSHYLINKEGSKVVYYTDGTKAITNVEKGIYQLIPKEFGQAYNYTSKEELDEQIEFFLYSTKHARKTRIHK